MTAAAAEIDQPVESAQIEGGRHARRADDTVAVEAEQKAAHRLGIAEEMLEHVSADVERLAPAICALAYGVLEVAPHRVERLIGEQHIPGERRGSGPAEIRGGEWCVGERPAGLLLEEAESHAGVKQALERIGIRVELAGEREAIRGGALQSIEDAQPERGEHHLGSPERVHQVDDGRRIGSCHAF